MELVVGGKSHKAHSLMLGGSFNDLVSNSSRCNICVDTIDDEWKHECWVLPGVTIICRV